MSDDTQTLLSLDVTEVTNVLVRPGGLWREVRVVAQTGSSNADLLAAAAAGAPEGTVLVAEAQTAGRGRLGRSWTSPPRAGLTFSVLLRPAGVPAALLGWLPLLAGVAAVAAVRSVAGVDASLKWPNDVLVGGAKLGGILAERSGGAVVAGIGINVWHGRADLPVDAPATSLALESDPTLEAGAVVPPGAALDAGPTLDAGAVVPPGAAPDDTGTALAAGAAGDPASALGTGALGLRERLLAGLLDSLARWYLAWRDQASPGDADACGLRAEYVSRCATLGREVTVTMPGAGPVTGTAAAVDETGRLVVRTAAGPVPVTAGDVVHVRPANERGA